MAATRVGRWAPTIRLGLGLWPKELWSADLLLIDVRLLGDPIQTEWVARILFREKRASGCFTQIAKNRCKTRHEKGNVTRMLGGRSRKLLKGLAPQAGFEPATLRLTAAAR